MYSSITEFHFAFLDILASIYGPGPYGSGPLGPYGPRPFIICLLYGPEAVCFSNIVLEHI